MKRRALAGWVCGAVVAAWALSHSTTLAGVSYLDPVGGWRYTYEGTFADGFPGCVDGVCPPGFGMANNEDALDGTWSHDQGDKWDGSGPGEVGPIPDGPAPGGAEALLEDSTTYIRVQDTGNPEEHGWEQDSLRPPINNNRRVFFGRKLEEDGALTSELVLDDGITVSFRARVPVSGPLDNVYGVNETNNGVIRRWFENGADYNQNSIVDAADFTVWRDTLDSTYDLRADADDGSGEGIPDGVVDQFDYDFWVAQYGETAERVGRGSPIHNDGRGMFNIVQNDLAFFNTDSSVGFSLITTKDIEVVCQEAPNANICETPGQNGGLVMNNLVGTSPSNNVDTTDVGGTLNLLEIDDADLHEWREFWVTIEDGSTGTHTVNVYMDGSTAPTTFHVTSNGNGDSTYGNDAWMTFGLNDSDGFGSFDMDFFSYTLGVVPPEPAPEAVPEPMTVVSLLAGMACLWLFRSRRR